MGTKDGVPDTIKIKIPDITKKNAFFEIQTLKKIIPTIKIKGLDGIKRVLINKEKDSASGRFKYAVIVEGYGLKEIMNMNGVNFAHTGSNHIMEIEQVLGIEAARQTIINEIR